MNLNKVYLIGRMASDPEFRTTPGGQEVATLRIATNRVWVNQSSGQKNEATEFHNVVTWGRLAQIANQYLTKGSLVMIEGRLQTRSWEGQDGIKRYKTEIVAEGLQLGPKRQSEPRPASEKSEPAAKPKGKEDASSLASAKEEIPVVNEEDLAGLEKDEESEVELKDVPF